MKFAPARALYKLYVTRRLTQLDEPAASDPIPEFLRLLVHQLDRCMTGPL